MLITPLFKYRNTPNFKIFYRRHACMTYINLTKIEETRRSCMATKFENLPIFFLRGIPKYVSIKVKIFTTNEGNPKSKIPATCLSQLHVHVIISHLCRKLSLKVAVYTVTIQSDSIENRIRTRPLWCGIRSPYGFCIVHTYRVQTYTNIAVVLLSS